jgi:acyl dehydratase
MEAWQKIEIGDQLPPLVKGPTKSQVEGFCKVANLGLNFFLDSEMAKKKGLPGPIVPGDISFCFIIQTLTHAFPQAILKDITVNFRNIVQHGDRLICQGVVTEKGKNEEGYYIECDLLITNQRGERTLVGRARLLFPSSSGDHC